VNVTITWQMVIAAIGLLTGWTGFLLGAIKWLLNRQITALEARLAAAEAKASEAASGLVEHKQTLSDAMAALRLEISSKFVCGNHARLERNDEKLFIRLDSLHGDIRELSGGVKGLAKSFEMVNEYLLSGGK